MLKIAAANIKVNHIMGQETQMEILLMEKGKVH